MIGVALIGELACGTDIDDRRPYDKFGHAVMQRRHHLNNERTQIARHDFDGSSLLPPPEHAPLVHAEHPHGIRQNVPGFGE